MTIRQRLEAIRDRCLCQKCVADNAHRNRQDAKDALAQIKTVYYCPDCDQHSENRDDFEDDCSVEAYLWARLPDPVAAATPPCDECQGRGYIISLGGSMVAEKDCPRCTPSSPSGT